MNSSTEKMAGCLLLMTFVICLLFGILGFAAKTIGSITDYKIAAVQAQADVDIAKLQAQATITVGCEANSWFTSMKQCIEYGGVNGFAGINWWLLGPVIVVAAWLFTKYIVARWTERE